MTLRLSETQDERLQRLSDKRGISKQKLIEDAVEKYLEYEYQKMLAREVIAEVLIRDAELLKRLGDQ